MLHVCSFSKSRQVECIGIPFYYVISLVGETSIYFCYHSYLKMQKNVSGLGMFPKRSFLRPCCRPCPASLPERSRSPGGRVGRSPGRQQAVGRRHQPLHRSRQNSQSSGCCHQCQTVEESSSDYSGEKNTTLNWNRKLDICCVSKCLCNLHYKI